ncbi:MAG: LytTR family DNA-binding domain-containing protein [bacterium]|nr:LytTR family DNA-binding domain-containing protein [bacterium]
MQVLVVEDEKAASRNVVRLVEKFLPEATILPVLESKSAAVGFLKENRGVDLIFLDIRLSDALSFEIFEEVSVSTPIIFITAYDQYAIKAFELESIDYLLKPIDEQKFERSIQRFKNRTGTIINAKILDQLRQIDSGSNYKSKYLIRKASTLVSINVEDIAYFYREGTVNLVTNQGETFPTNFNLDALEAELDPKKFYRLNRQFLVQDSSISMVHDFFKSKLKVDLKPEIEIDVIVSQEKAPFFKKWLNGE